MHVDYLIVGQGLAGTLVAAELASRGRETLVVDPQHHQASSVIAAGLYTPVTGQRLVLTWRAREMLAFAASTYQGLEAKYDTSFFHPLNTLRLFQNEEEQTLWMQKQDDPELQAYIAERHLPERQPFQAPFGGFELAGSGWVDLKALVSMLPDSMILRERFDPAECEPLATGIRWRDVTAQRLILCEGFQAEHNPWFARLPFRSAHGELLTVRVPDAPETHIVNSGVFMLPLGDQRFRVGATYEWNVSEPRTSDSGKQQLLERLSRWMPFPVEVLDHRAGIRPIATQRVPVAGTHPDYPAIAVLNGLGSKGVLYAPFYAKQLIDHLEEGTPLDREVALENRMKG